MGEQLIEACRRNNVDLLAEIIQNCKNDREISDVLNNTTTVMGNHLYHEAALQGNCTCHVTFPLVAPTPLLLALFEPEAAAGCPAFRS